MVESATYSKSLFENEICFSYSCSIPINSKLLLTKLFLTNYGKSTKKSIKTWSELIALKNKFLQVINQLLGKTINA